MKIYRDYYVDYKTGKTCVSNVNQIIPAVLLWELKFHRNHTLFFNTFPRERETQQNFHFIVTWQM